jgi:hypothetical protein
VPFGYSYSSLSSGEDYKCNSEPEVYNVLKSEGMEITSEHEFLII